MTVATYHALTTCRALRPQRESWHLSVGRPLLPDQVAAYGIGPGVLGAQRGPARRPQARERGAERVATGRGGGAPGGARGGGWGPTRAGKMPRPERPRVGGCATTVGRGDGVAVASTSRLAARRSRKVASTPGPSSSR